MLIDYQIVIVFNGPHLALGVFQPQQNGVLSVLSPPPQASFKLRRPRRRDKDKGSVYKAGISYDRSTLDINVKNNVESGLKPGKNLLPACSIEFAVDLRPFQKGAPVTHILEGSSADEKTMKDGIAIAFCEVDIPRMKLCFSGSYNPLYYIHNNMLSEYKPDRIPIGHTSENEQEKGNFTDHSMEIKKGDVIYLFSDGYADQTGGPRKKKFYYAPFKEMILRIHNLPMDEQMKKMDTTILEWMDGREQLDDITVIGIRF